ncbi:m7GpppX diphosphatase [Ciona intestinalis]
MNTSSTDGSSSTSTKRLKLSESSNGDATASRKSLSGVELVSVLNDKTSQKAIFLHGRIASAKSDQTDDDAVIILEKKPFDQSQLQEILSSQTKLTVDLENDIYSTYTAYPPPLVSDIKATVICPATKKHIRKYMKQKLTVVQETKEDYLNITLPYLEKQFASNVFNLQWVFNILEHKAETERVLFEDDNKNTGFMLMPDMKWDRSDVKSLYVMALPHKRGLKSIRDLTAEHIPLLENILTKGLEVVEKLFKIPANELRVYFHYQPSYYHLHIHINHIDLDLPGTEALRAHLLADVIENLKLTGDYYQNKTFTFALQENNLLFTEFAKAIKASN